MCCNERGTTKMCAGLAREPVQSVPLVPRTPVLPALGPVGREHVQREQRAQEGGCAGLSPGLD